MTDVSIVNTSTVLVLYPERLNVTALSYMTDILRKLGDKTFDYMKPQKTYFFLNTWQTEHLYLHLL